MKQLSQRSAGIVSRSFGQVRQRLIVELGVMFISGEEGIDDCNKSGVELQQDLRKRRLCNAITLCKVLSSSVYTSLILPTNLLWSQPQALGQSVLIFVPCLIMIILLPTSPLLPALRLPKLPEHVQTTGKGGDD